MNENKEIPIATPADRLQTTPKKRRINSVLLHALALPATATDTGTRVCEISYGVLNKYGNTPASYAIIGTAGLGYFLYNFRFSKEGIEEIYDTPKKFKKFNKKPIAIATAAAILPIALAWMATSDGSTNFFFLDNIDDILQVDNMPFFQKTWRTVSLVLAIFNVMNYMVTEGVQGALKMLQQLGLTNNEDNDENLLLEPTKSSYYDITKRISASVLGITGGSIEAAMALSTVVINFGIDSLGLKIAVAFFSLFTLYVNYALRGKVIEETMDDIKDNYPTAIRNPASWVAGILSASMAGLIAFSLQPLTIDMLNDGLDDLNLITNNNKKAMNYFIFAVSILNAINDFATFSNAFYEMGHQFIVNPYDNYRNNRPTRGYTSIP